MTAQLHLVDAFAHAPFTGNPAGVCLLESEAPVAWMQALAAELKQSETAFVVPIDSSAGRAPGSGGATKEFSLRWFTPTSEVDLCGHATLASAHVLWNTGVLGEREQARFQTRSGWLTCALRPDGSIEMDFPAHRPLAQDAPGDLAAALGCHPVWTGKTRFDWFVEVASAAELKALRPDFARLVSLKVRGVIVTAPGETGSGADFCSRFFAPGVGVDEDPVTGSAHCALGPHWAAKLGRNPLVGLQVSARSGYVEVEVHAARVALRGVSWARSHREEIVAENGEIVKNKK